MAKWDFDKIDAEKAKLTADLAAAEAKLAKHEALMDAGFAEYERRLAQAVEVLGRWVALVDHCNIETGFCCCGEEMENHSSPMDCNHTPVDKGSYVALGLVESTRAFLATIQPKGETDDKA